MNNEERDGMIKAMHDIIVREKPNFHNPYNCPALEKHKRSHMEWIKYIAVIMGIVSVTAGGLFSYIKIAVAASKMVTP